MIHIISDLNETNCLRQMGDLVKQGIKFEKHPLFVYWHDKESMSKLRGLRLTPQEFKTYCHGHFNSEQLMMLGLSNNDR